VSNATRTASSVWVQEDDSIPYGAPKVFLASGPKEGETLLASEVTFTFAASDDEIEAGTTDVSAITYSYMLSGIDSAFTLFDKTVSVKYTNVPDGNYTFFLRANDINGWTSKTFIRNFSIDTTTTEALVGPKIVALAGDGQVLLQWNDAGGEDGYEIYRRDASGGIIKLTNSRLPANTLSFADLTAINAKTYSYFVKAIDSVTFRSVYSNEVSATPIGAFGGQDTLAVNVSSIDMGISSSSSTFILSNAEKTFPIKWSLSPSSSVLSVSPSAGEILEEAQSVNVSVDRSQLSGQVHNLYLMLTTNAGAVLPLDIVQNSFLIPIKVGIPGPVSFDGYRMQRDEGSGFLEGGNSNFILENGENAFIQIFLKNLGSVSTLSTSAVVTCPVDYVNILGKNEVKFTNEEKNSIPPGESASTDPINVSVLQSAPGKKGGLPIRFLVNVLDSSGYEWNTSFEVPIYKIGPIVVVGYTIDDDNFGFSSGNGNGIIEKGEQVELGFTLKNNGVEDLQNVVVLLSENEESGILVKWPRRVEIGNLNGLSEITLSNDFDIDAKDYKRTEIRFNVEITASSIIGTKDLSYKFGDAIVANPNTPTPLPPDYTPATATVTKTPTNTLIPTETSTFTVTATSTVPTNTPTITQTASLTATFTQTYTETPTITPTPTNTYPAVFGFVMKAENPNDPIPNAVIRILQQNVMSNVDGSYTVTDVQPGIQTIEAFASGRLPFSAQVLVKTGENTLFLIMMEQAPPTRTPTPTEQPTSSPTTPSGGASFIADLNYDGKVDYRDVFELSRLWYNPNYHPGSVNKTPVPTDNEYQKCVNEIIKRWHTVLE